MVDGWSLWAFKPAYILAAAMELCSSSDGDERGPLSTGPTVNVGGFKADVPELVLGSGSMVTSTSIWNKILTTMTNDFYLKSG